MFVLIQLVSSEDETTVVKKEKKQDHNPMIQSVSIYHIVMETRLISPLPWDV